MNVKIFKLTSGEEFLGEIVSEPDMNDGKWQVKNPVVVGQNPENPGQMHFRPWIALSKDKTVNISESNVMVEPEPAIDQLEKAYQEAFSGIALPDKPSIQLVD